MFRGSPRFWVSVAALSVGVGFTFTGHMFGLAGIIIGLIMGIIIGRR